MNNQSDMNRLTQELRRQAAEGAPGFSPLLHARIMQRIRQSDVPLDITGITPATAASTAPPVGWPRSYRLAFAGLAAAASVALLILVHSWSAPADNTRIARPSPIVTAQRHLPLPQFAIIDDLTAPTSRQLEDARFAYLDRDAKHFASYMMRQVDVLPARQ